jgi:hypothetical protein
MICLTSTFAAPSTAILFSRFPDLQKCRHQQKDNHHFRLANIAVVKKVCRYSNVFSATTFTAFPCLGTHNGKRYFDKLKLNKGNGHGSPVK